MNYDEFDYNCAMIIMQKYIIYTIALLFLVTPLCIYAQTTTGNGTSSLPQTFMLPMGTSTEPIEHGQVTVDIGIERRFSESPDALAEVDISASRVLNKRRLQVFSRHLALTQPIKEMNVGDDVVRVLITSRAKLIGLIPVGVNYEITAEIDEGKLSRVRTERVSGNWWSPLAVKPNTENITQAIKSSITETNYLSITQLRAIILEAIVNAA